MGSILGIEIDKDKNVIYTNRHHNLVSTCNNSNPTMVRIDNILIYSIFKRMRSKDHSGDGNPLIYALKNKNGYKISKKEIKKFFIDIDIIIEKFLIDKNYDLILIPPSKHKIAHFLAKRIKKKLKIKYCKDFFRKATAKEVIEDIDLTLIKNKVHKRDVKRVLSTLEKLDAKEFTMKEVPNKLRIYFDPLRINLIDYDLSSYNEILIVDDLLSTGNTIIKASEKIIKIKGKLKVEALCLLSSL